MGKVRSQGFEFDLTGRWTKIGASSPITRMTTFAPCQGVVDPKSATEITTQHRVTGNVLPGSPRNYGNLWVKYEAAGGVVGSEPRGRRHGGRQPARRQRQFFRPAGLCAARAMVSYQFKIDGYTVTAQVNGNNLTNTRYFTTSIQQIQSHSRRADDDHGLAAPRILNYINI